MTEERWRVLAEFTGENDPDHNRQVIERFATAVNELNLPSAFLERVQAAVTEAMRKAFDYHEDQAAYGAVVFRVLVSGVKPDDEKIKPGWGFFSVEKDLAIAQRLIELFLYQDGK